ncbi:MAG: glycoside hydrolase family 2 [Bacteroidales bacterium]|nr:glycoside hydrolase family 2 [Bacteroidales bacterium]
MKKFFLLSFVMTLGVSALAGPLTHWTLRQEGQKTSYQVTVPCTVAGALNEAGFFGPDILDQDHYKAIDKSIFDQPWEFTTTFKAQSGLRHVLRFEGLSYYADIELNGKLIASRDTTFGAYSVREFDITALAKGKNTLKVTLRRAHEGDLNAGYVDWNPRPVDESMGIIRPVTLISTPDVQVQDIYVQPLVEPSDLSTAQFIAKVTLVNRSNKAVEGTVEGTYEGGKFQAPVSLAAGESKQISVTQEVENPRIWWTAELGKPELYHLDVAFCKGKKVSHSASATFGLRSIESEITPFGHRQFILNGRKVLVKSAGWTDDIFMQDTPESIEAQIKMVADMGLNSIRFENIWGKDHTVYDLCDQYGLMALVGFSCQWEWENYCGLPETKGYGCINDPASEALAVRYFHDQVVWLRNHPSVIGWLTGSDRIPNKRLETQYLAIYEKLDYRPYVCSAKGLRSLAGPSGMKMEGPYEYVGPDYWWIDNRSGGNYGFNTETGPGLQMPQIESVKRMVGEKDLWPVGPNWAYHCTASSSVMNNTSFLENAMKELYGHIEDLDDFMRKAHAMDYDATRSMYEAFRANVPAATGIVQWMLNSAWPSFYWQLYDWYGIPTAGYYGVKVANAPVQAVYNYGDNCVYVVNDGVPAARYQIKFRVYDRHGHLTHLEQDNVTSRPRDPRKVGSPVQGPGFLAVEVIGKNYHASNFYCIPGELNRYKWHRADWWGIPIEKYTNMRFVTRLPKTTLGMQVVPADGGYDVTLTNDSDVIAYQNILKALDQKGELIPGTFWTDNFFTVLPGESRTVHCTLPAGCTQAKIGFSGWNAKIAE